MRNTINYLPLFVFICGIGLLFSGCSTKKNTFVNRSFHNLTARYNGYFYAKESIKEGVVKLEKGHFDDYARVLPVYQLGDEKAAKSVYPEMDRAFKKSSNVIQRHSIFIKDIEYVKWIDDNYMTIGISHYYKKDYFAAIEVFDYVLKQYKKNEIKYDAMVWLIRSYNEGAIVSKAQTLIDMVDNDSKFPKRIRAELDMAIADFYLKREDYPLTAKYVEKALINVKKKKTKIRLTYILAQLYQKTEDNRKASTYFAEVVKLNPPYEMAFQAKISQAKAFDGSEKRKNEIKGQLVKMLKDSKNKEYFDQIYYALAEMSMSDKDEKEAIKYLNLSVSSSIENVKQKALSYLKLGEIYFAKPEYKAAQTYYDSCAGILPSNHPDYEAIMSKRESLTGLIVNLTTISTEDSLQKIARMSEAERNEYLDIVIENIIKEEIRKKREDQERLEQLSNQPLSQQGQQVSGVSTGSVWYFYNNTATSFGFAEFRKKWGDRTLEDNWRRSIKESGIFDIDGNEEKELSDTIDPLEALRDKEKYLKDLPLTEEKMILSTQKIVDAYYNAGIIYKEQFADNKNTVKILEEFIGRFPESFYKLQCFYQLYRCNLALENHKRADYYKDILLNQYADSEYSRIIRNPDQYKTTTASKNEIEAFYIETYQKYNEAEYVLVLANCYRADTLYAKSEHSAKFNFLKALVIGKTQGIVPFERELREIVVNYPNDPVNLKAKEMLEYIENTKPEPAMEIASKYKFEKEASHNYMLFIPTQTNINDLKIAVSDFNSTYFSTSQLSITNLFFNDSIQILVVKGDGLADKTKAMTYYTAIKEDEMVIQKAGGKMVEFAISTANYPIFFKDKNVDEYKAFFDLKYLEKKQKNN
ncbi:MAG: tetratricopeptide repeat protein [Bacteroidetes bacterium]|nr:tetratricopeptide repeat protein [Bacteroidota bacterium]